MFILSFINYLYFINNRAVVVVFLSEYFNSYCYVRRKLSLLGRVALALHQ